MAAYIAIFLSLVSLVVFIIILIKFKKLFSTDQLVSKTQRYIEKMVSDMNNQTMRDMELINENSKQLRELLLQAENNVKKYNEAADRLRSMISQIDNLKTNSYEMNFYNEVVPEKKVVHYQENKNVAPLKTVSQRNKENLEKRYKTASKKAVEKIDPEAKYELNGQNPIQNSLFDDIEEIKVTPDGAAYKEVPFIRTKVLDETPVSKDFVSLNNTGRSLSDKVHELFAQSFPVEKIASVLNCSVTEVQTIIDLGL